MSFDFSQNVMLSVGAPWPDPHAAPPDYALLADAVERLKDHPAILTWYLTDERGAGPTPRNPRTTDDGN